MMGCQDCQSKDFPQTGRCCLTPPACFQVTWLDLQSQPRRKEVPCLKRHCFCGDLTLISTQGHFIQQPDPGCNRNWDRTLKCSKKPLLKESNGLDNGRPSSPYALAELRHINNEDIHTIWTFWLKPISNIVKPYTPPGNKIGQSYING
jgi:hypothetical protein